MKVFGDFLIGDTSVFGFIDGEQDMGVFDFFAFAFPVETSVLSSARSSTVNVTLYISRILTSL